MLNNENRMLSEHTSPEDLGAAIVSALSPKQSHLVYDGAFGRLGFLLTVKNYIEDKYQLTPKLENFYGREVNQEVFLRSVAIAKQMGLESPNFINADTLQAIEQEVEKFDIVLSHPPFGMKCAKRIGALGIEATDAIVLFLQHYVASLKKGGKAAVIVPNSFFSSISKSYLLLRKHIIEECNLYGVLELPQKTFENTGIGASVVFIEKGTPTETTKYYLKQKDEGYQGFLDFIIDGIPSENAYLYDIKDLDNENCILPSARTFAINKEITTRTKNFSHFQCYNIRELCNEINLTKDFFEERDNTVYLPKIGKSDPVTTLEKAKLKHQNYFQLVLDESKISNDYMVYFLKSSLGKMLLEGLFTGATIPSISKATLESAMEVYAPTKDEQILIGSAFKELEGVQKLMERTTIELCSNPNSARLILDRLHSTKGVFDELSEEEKTLRLIEGGENLKVEFKETLSKNIHTGKKDPNLHLAVLKNIVGFLNKAGGHLLVGVADSGEIKGIENDFYQSDDHYKLQLSNLINDRIGSKETEYIRYKISNVSGKKVCVIDCDKSPMPAYLDGDFYLRSDPECKKLSTKEANEYIKQNFKGE